MSITSKELKFAAAGIALILVWFLYIRQLIAPMLENLPPLVAMLIYNSGLFFGLFMLSAPLNGKAKRLKATIISFVTVLGVDILYAPYLVNSDGSLIKSLDLWFVATDAAVGAFYNSFLPAGFVWPATYIITPIILIFIIPVMLLAPKQVAKLFGH